MARRHSQHLHDAIQVSKISSSSALKDTAKAAPFEGCLGYEPILLSRLKLPTIPFKRASKSHWGHMTSASRPQAVCFLLHSRQRPTAPSGASEKCTLNSHHNRLLKCVKQTVWQRAGEAVLQVLCVIRGHPQAPSLAWPSPFSFGTCDTHVA